MIEFEFEFQYAEAKLPILRQVGGSIPAGRCVVLCGGSGCGCCASVLNAYLLERIEKGDLRRIFFMATGALLSPTSSMQNDSIPGIAHGIVLERK